MGGIKSGRGRVVVIREYDGNREGERESVEEVERMCEVGPSDAKLSLFTHLLGDPICRVRHSPPFLMLVSISFFHFPKIPLSLTSLLVLINY